ncbi:MAG TPA: hypothetical protein VJS88_02980 [Chthoniobacterales bacterium]|nr:hypothetical protein [Chthoniobacterales bacterium]
MAAPSSDNPAESASVQVSMPRVVKFIRQLAHDLRNHLNAAELQSAYLIEIAENNDLREEIKRLRRMISEVGTDLQKLTAALSPPRVTEMAYSAKELMEDLQQKLGSVNPDEAAQVEWKIAETDATLNIDPQLLLPALLELFMNAFRHGRGEGALSFSAGPKNGSYVLALMEPKKGFEHSTENWGREPLRSPAQGHYGLGLYRARSIVEAHGGGFEAHYDKSASTLNTQVTLPIAPASA